MGRGGEECPPAFVAPAHLWVPEGRRGTWGPEIVEFSASIGHPVDAEQAADLDAFGSYGRGGLYLVDETCKIEGRQNGKTDRVVLPQTLFDFFVRGVRFVTWTAHLMDTTRKTMKIVHELIDANAVLSSRVREITTGRDSEAIVLRSGAVWEWRARTDAGGRGGQADVWVADEALYLTHGMIAARRPTMRSRPGAQMRLASSAALKRSTYLRSVVRRGRARNDPTLIYSEHCAPGSFEEPGCQLAGCSHVYGTRGCTLDREDLWHHANHAMGRRISYATMRSERRTMHPTEFARELLGWHEAGPDDDETIPVERWDKLVDRSSSVRKGARPVFALMVRPDQSSAALAVAGHRHDDKVHVGLIRQALPLGQVRGELLRLSQKYRPWTVVLAPGPATKRLAPQLKAAGIRIRVAVENELAQAAAATLAGVKADDTRHRGDELVRLSLESLERRDTTDGGWTADLTGDGDAAPFVAVMLARWGVSIGPRPYDVLNSAW